MSTTYDISYHTKNTYEENVREAFYSFLIIPSNEETQAVLNLSFHNSLKAEVFHHSNLYGFEVTSLHTDKPFREFEFQMAATVVKSALDLPIGGELSVEEEQSLVNRLDFYIDNHLFLGSAPYTHIEDSYRSNLLFRREDQTILDYLTQLNESIHTMLEYDPEPTNVHTTVSEVLQLGRGVCQDYTHLFIGLARLNKIPCRYVTGYLNQGINLSGTAVMHAWAEAFIPGFGWQGFDPTNNLLADIHYIKAAHGADYSDCSPIKGVVKTTGGQKTAYGVKIIPQHLAGADQQ
ncbi:MAG: transglutaminase family protein [Bacteroidota bacterium]|nr:transglutaminase family protein [Bacteroidota bacterium]